jgi:glycosyltransferase involved in cell wall biosynthesis
MNMASNFERGSAAPRIQVFVSDLAATGVVRNAVAIANEAAASGYDVRLLTCRPDGVLRNQIRPDVTLVKLLKGTESGHSRRFELKQALVEYRRHSRQWRPDIMLSAGNHGHLLSTFAWFGLPGTKVLRISNDLNHGSPSAAVRWWRDHKFRLIAGLADRLALVSRAHGGHPMLARHLASGKALVIPNGVDVEGVRAASRQPFTHPWALNRDVPVVLAAGRHVRQKNFDTLLRAFAIARRTQHMRLLFLGDGSMDETARLSTLTLELGIADDVDFVPATANPFPLMAAAGALALPSLWEGSSNVLLEAMACGTPVIASRTAGDAAHVLDEGRYGLLVDPHDVEGLAAALVRQTGADPLEPGTRVQSFARDGAMRRYIQMFDQAVAGTVRRAPAFASL